MFDSISGVEVPYFQITEVPDLEVALNRLGDAIRDTAGKIPVIEGGKNVQVVSSGRSILIDIEESSAQKSRTRFQVSYSAEQNKLFVSTGLVAMIDGSTASILVPKIDGRPIYHELHFKYVSNGSGRPGLSTSQVGNNEVWRVYVRVVGEECDIFLHDFRDKQPPSSGSADLLFPIADFSKTEGESFIDQLWSSDIAVSGLKKCPFRVTDATEYKTDTQSNLQVKIANGKVKTLDSDPDQRYPDGMGEETEYVLKINSDNTDWLGVYCVIKFDADTHKVGDYPSAITFSVENTLKKNTYTTQYELVAHITKSFDKEGHIYISDVSSICGEIIADKNKLTPYCPFEVVDATTYSDEGYPTALRLAVQVDEVYGRLPYEMAWGAPYIITPTSEELNAGTLYIYLNALVDEYGELHEYDTALSIVTTKYQRQTGSCIQWFLIAQVDFVQVDNRSYIKNITNSCPIVYILKPSGCAFEVEDASTDTVLSVQVRNGEMAGRYPNLMVEKGNFRLNIDPNYSPWYAIYAVIRLKDDGTVKEDEYAVEIKVEAAYKKSDYTVIYALIGEVTVSDREDGSKYISYIQNYCYIPEIPKDIDGCPFKVTDFSTYQDLDKPVNALVKVRNSKVQNRYPNKMGENVDYILSITDDYVDAAGISYVYLTALFDEFGKLRSDTTALTIGLSPKPLPSGSCIQRHRIASVETKVDSIGRRVIVPSKISNNCPVVGEQPLNSCAFEIEDATDIDSEQLKVLIRNGKIDDKVYPDGMSEGDPYIYTLSGQDPWYAVYIVIQLDENGNIADYPSAVSILIVNDYKESSPSTIYALIGEITTSYDYNSQWYISYIQNYCYIPTVGGGKNCPFELSDYSTYQDGEPTNCRVKVKPSKVDGRYPMDMSQADNFVLDIYREDVSDYGRCYIYLQLLVDEYGVPFDYSTAITIEASRYFIPTGSCIQRYLIGTVEVNTSAMTIIPNTITNNCPIITLGNLDDCPFQVEDASEDGNMKVQIRTGFVDGNRYPYGMAYRVRYLLDVPQDDGDRHYVYMLLSLKANGEIEDGVESISLQIYNELKESNSRLKYVLLAEINNAYTGDSQYITNILNYCIVPTGDKVEAPCSFELKDASTYEQTQNGELVATDCAVLIANTTINDRYPLGMSDNGRYILRFNSNDFEPESVYGRCYVYLKVLVDDDADIYDYDTAITIEKSPYYYDSKDNFTYQRILIGYVDADLTDGVRMVSYGVRSECPILTLNRPSDCLFKIEDSSDLLVGGTSSIIIRNGKINGRFPSGMSKNTIYSLDVDSIGTNYVYAVISIDSDGNALDGEDGDSSISFLVSNTYKTNTVSIYYAPIGIIEKKEQGQLLIQSYCVDPSIPTKQVIGCTFKTVDVSPYGPEQIAPTSLRVQIANSTIMGIYPENMSAEGDYLLTLEPNTDFDEAGICYIYAKALLDEFGNILELKIVKENKFHTKGSYIQWIPISKVYISDVAYGKEITKIANFCPSDVIDTPQSCPFYAEDAGDGNLHVLNSKIEGVLASNMDEGVPFYISTSGGGQIQYLIADIKLDVNGAIDYDSADAIQIYLSSYALKSNVYYMRAILATVYVSYSTGSPIITGVDNYCYIPTPPYTSNCPFEVVDASDYKEDGTIEGNGKRIVVRNWTIYDRYPAGMDSATFYDYSLTYQPYIYIGVSIGSDGKPLSGPSSIWIEASMTSKTSDSTTNYILIAEISYEENGNISLIKNRCATEPSGTVGGGGGACHFRVQDASEVIAGENHIKVKVDYGVIDNRTPENMTLGEDFTLNGFDENFYVMAALRFDENTLFLSEDSDAIRIITTTTLERSTLDTQYTLIAAVLVSTGASPTGKAMITKISQNCLEVVPNPCSLAWN